MPKVVSVPEGLYFVGTEEPRLISQTNAGAYIAAFTKSREEAFDLAKKQALMNIENEQLKYEADLKFTLDQQKAIQDRLAKLDKSIADIEAGRVDAVNEMRKYGLGVAADIAKKNADLEATRKGKVAERAFPSVGSSFTYQTGTGAGFGTGETGPSKLTEKEQAELADSSRAGGGNPVTAIDDYSRKLQAAEGSENPQIMKTKQGAMVANEVKQYMARNPSASKEEAEAEILLQLDDAGKNSFVDAYTSLYMPTQAPGAGDELNIRSESVRTYDIVPKYAPISQTTVGEVTPIQYDVEKADPAALNAIRKQLEDQLKVLELPLPPEQDLITAARRIYRDRFGPTTGGRAGFEERLRSAQMVNEPAKGAQAIETFRDITMPEVSPETRRSLIDSSGGVKPILDLQQFDATALEAPRMTPETQATKAPMEPKETMQNVFVASNQATEKVSKPSANRYLLQRYLAGKQLAEQASKLDRLINSGPGKVASQVYAGNVSKNLPLSKTLEEITFTYADDPIMRDKAIDIAMALDLKSENSKKMPTV